jgi:hypothetical protein
MTFQIIRRAFAENLHAFECKPCGLSMTDSESSTTPAIVPDSTPTLTQIKVTSRPTG